MAGVLRWSGVCVAGRCRCAGACDHYRDQSDDLERGESLPEGEEADDGRDCRIDAVDDGDDPRLEAAETLSSSVNGMIRPATAITSPMARYRMSTALACPI